MTNVGGQGPVSLAVGWTAASLGMLVLGMRIYGIRTGAGHLRWDMFWSITAIIVALVAHVFLNLAVFAGAGNHLVKLQISNFINIVRWVFAYGIVAVIASTFAKFSVIAQLIQIQGPQARKRNYVLWFLGALLSIATLMSIIMEVFQCTPTSKFWNILSTDGNCDKSRLSEQLNFFQGAVAALTSVVLSLWPISIAWNLQMSMRTKVGFCVLMALGIVPTSAVIYRTTMLPSLRRSTDPIYNLGRFFIWFGIEQWSVIIIASIPPLRPLFLRLFRSVSGTGSASNLRSAPTLNTTSHAAIPGTLQDEKDYGKYGGIQRVTTITKTSVPVSESRNSLETEGV